MTINKKKLLCAMIDAEMNNAKLSEVSGVSIGQISNIRRGRGTTYDTALKLSNALGVSVFTLINEVSS